MVRTALGGWSALIAALALLAGPAYAQQEEGYGEKKTEEQKQAHEGHGQMTEEQMQAWMQASMPDEHHKALDPLTGKWQQKVTWWMGPDAPPDTSNSRAELEWVFDGRFLKQKVTGEPEQGMQFQGMGMLGYNKLTKKYESFWIDNMGTQMYFAQGTASQGGKVITFTGDYVDPMTNKKETGRTVYRIESSDRFVMEMYEPDESGKEYKALEVIYTRSGTSPAEAESTEG